jgi:uncharacterized membrane protein
VRAAADQPVDSLAAPVVLAVTSYDFSLFLHVTAVVVGFGATFAESITFPVAMAMNKRYLPYVHRLQRSINSWFTGPAMIVIIATGFYQVSDRDWDLGDFWLSGTFTIVIILGALLGAYFIPEDRRLEAMALRDIEASGDGEVVLSEEYQRRSRNEGIVGGITGLLIVIAIYLMITKPGLS